MTGSPQAAHQPAGVRAGRRGRHLLAEHRADREFGRVDRAGYPPARGLVHERGKQRIAAKQIVHGDRVGVEVEQPAAAADRDGQVAQVAESELAGRCGPAAAAGPTMPWPCGSRRVRR